MSFKQDHDNLQVSTQSTAINVQRIGRGGRASAVSALVKNEILTHSQGTTRSREQPPNELKIRHIRRQCRNLNAVYSNQRSTNRKKRTSKRSVSTRQPVQQKPARNEVLIHSQGTTRSREQPSNEFEIRHIQRPCRSNSRTRDYNLQSRGDHTPLA